MGPSQVQLAGAGAKENSREREFSYAWQRITECQQIRQQQKMSLIDRGGSRGIASYRGKYSKSSLEDAPVACGWGKLGYGCLDLVEVEVC